MGAICLAAFFVFAVTNWVAVARGSKALEYVAKPATLAALIGYAAFDEHASGWLLAALAFSLIGDVLLMLPVNAFAAGLAAFLLAHVAYILAFDGDVGATLPWLAVTLLATAPVATRLLRGVPAPALRCAVAAYIGVIAFMGATAIASENVIATAGAALFMASDSLLAWNRFVERFAWAQLAIMVTYHLGQLGLTVGLH